MLCPTFQFPAASTRITWLYCSQMPSTVSGSPMIRICRSSSLSFSSHSAGVRRSRRIQPRTVSRNRTPAAKAWASTSNRNRKAPRAGSHISSSSPRLRPSQSRFSGRCRGSRKRTVITPKKRYIKQYTREAAIILLSLLSRIPVPPAARSPSAGAAGGSRRSCPPADPSFLPVPAGSYPGFPPGASPPPAGRAAG